MSDFYVNNIFPTTGNIVKVNGVEISTPVTGNTILGANAGAAIIPGPNPWDSVKNTAVGENALESNTTGKQNTAVGYEAYKLGNGTGDVALGQGSLMAVNGFSYGNTGVGTNSFFQLASAASANTGVGVGAGDQLTSGDFNTFVGATAGFQFNGGNENTAIGSRTTAIGTPTPGSGNVFLGTNACLNYSGGDNNVIIGSYPVSAPYTTAQSGSNNIVIGRIATKATVSASNSITLGNSSHTVLRCNVTSITSLSDARDKKDVAELSAGLDFVKG